MKTLGIIYLCTSILFGGGMAFFAQAVGADWFRVVDRATTIGITVVLVCRLVKEFPLGFHPESYTSHLFRFGVYPRRTTSSGQHLKFLLISAKQISDTEFPIDSPHLL